MNCSIAGVTWLAGRDTLPAGSAFIGYSSAMVDWLSSLTKVLEVEPCAMVVSVIAVDGSVPREIGATIIVSMSAVHGTIGGGNLEYTVVRLAREALPSSVDNHCHQLSLGPSLGQCCGGRVEILFERVTSDCGWINDIAGATHTSAARWLLRRVDQSQYQILTSDELGACSTAATFITLKDNIRWLCSPLSCLLYTSPSPRDRTRSRMPSSA